MTDVLPTAELHVHIEGTLEPDLVFRLAARNGVALVHRSPQALAAAYEFTSLSSFLAIYYQNMAVLREAEDFADMTEAYLAQAASRGVRRAEIFFDPQAHLSRGVPMAELMAGLTAHLPDAPARFGISAALIPCFLRDLGAEAAMDCLRALMPYRGQFIGVGLDSAEVGHPPIAFREVFLAAGAEGLHRVAHAGEEGPPDYVWQALNELGAERIDHGVRSLEDPVLVKRLAAEAVPLTVCPMSNLRLRVCAGWADLPVARMAASGLMVTINSDDPAYFGGYIDDNYRALRNELKMNNEMLRQIAANSFRASFLDDADKARYLALLG